jgi:hypothetical protein
MWRDGRTDRRLIVAFAILGTRLKDLTPIQKSRFSFIPDLKGGEM